MSEATPGPVRKRRLEDPTSTGSAAGQLDLARVATLAYSSEAPDHPVEQVLDGHCGPGGTRWLASEADTSATLVVEFDAPQPHEGGHVENRVVIEKLLAQLPAELRTTLVLREMEQLSYEEVAEVMRVPIGTVRSRLHTARERFRKLWVEAVGE